MHQVLVLDACFCFCSANILALLSCALYSLHRSCTPFHSSAYVCNSSSPASWEMSPLCCLWKMPVKQSQLRFTKWSIKLKATLVSDVYLQGCWQTRIFLVTTSGRSLLAPPANGDICISVIQQREQQQHQQSRTRCWELQQSVRCGPLQSPQLRRLLGTGRPYRPSVLPADQPHPEGGPLPEPAEPRPPQRHMMTSWRPSVSRRRTESLRHVGAPHAESLLTALPHPSPATVISHSSTYLWMETNSWSGIWRVFIVQINQSDNYFSNNNCVIHFDIFVIHLISDQSGLHAALRAITVTDWWWWWWIPVFCLQCCMNTVLLGLPKRRQTQF